MSNRIRRGGVMLALILGLGLAGATPASAAEPVWSQAWHWLTGLVDASGWGIDLSGGAASHASGSPASLHPAWQTEGPGFDPNGNPNGGAGSNPGIQEGPGFDPNGGAR